VLLRLYLQNFGNMDDDNKEDFLSEAVLHLNLRRFFSIEKYQFSKIINKISQRCPNIETLSGLSIKPSSETSTDEDNTLILTPLCYLDNLQSLQFDTLSVNSLIIETVLKFNNLQILDITTLEIDENFTNFDKLKIRKLKSDANFLQFCHLEKLTSFRTKISENSMILDILVENLRKFPNLRKLHVDLTLKSLPDVESLQNFVSNIRKMRQINKFSVNLKSEASFVSEISKIPIITRHVTEIEVFTDNGKKNNFLDDLIRFGNLKHLLYSTGYCNAEILLHKIPSLQQIVSVNKDWTLWRGNFCFNLEETVKYAR